MKKILQILFLAFIFSIKKLYRKKRKENTENAVILTVLFSILNLHSILTLIELNSSMDFGIKSFWKPSNVPKASYGFLFGIIFIAVFYGANLILPRSYNAKRIYLLRKAINISMPRLLSICYTFFTIGLFFFVIYQLGTTLAKIN